MTDKPTPTDAELEALLLDKLPASKHYIRPVIEKMVAAMQAAIDKWGQPAQETNGRKVFVCTHCDGVYADQPVTQCDCLPDENTFTEGWICFGAPAQAAEPVAWLDPWTGTKVTTDYDAYGKHGIPLYTAPQPVAREPLDEARRLFDAGWKAAALFCDREDVVADGTIGFGACPQFEAAFKAARAAQNEG